MGDRDSMYYKLAVQTLAGTESGGDSPVYALDG